MSTSFLPKWLRDREEFKNVEKAVNPLLLLEQPPEERSRPGEVAIASRWLRENVEVLSAFSQSKLEEVTKCLRCTRYSAGDAIRPEGGDGRLFVILSGKVCLGAEHGEVQRWLNTGKVGVPGGGSFRSSVRELSPLEIAALDEVPRILKNPFLLCRTECFGTMQIIQTRFGECPATAVENSQILVLSAEDGERISDEFAATDITDTVNFLRSLSLFVSWSRSRLARLADHVIHRIYPAGEPIVRQGDLPIHMYFIKRGVCAVSKDNLKHHVLRWPSSTSGDSGSLYEVKEWDTAVSVDLGKLHAGTYFGESSIMNGTPRQAHVRAESLVEVLALHSSHMMDLLHNDTLYKLQEHQMSYKEFEALKRRTRMLNDPVARVLQRKRALETVVGGPTSKLLQSFVQPGANKDLPSLGSLKMGYLESLEGSGRISPIQSASPAKVRFQNAVHQTISALRYAKLASPKAAVPPQPPQMIRLTGTMMSPTGGQVDTVGFLKSFATPMTLLLPRAKTPPRLPTPPRPHSLGPLSIKPVQLQLSPITPSSREKIRQTDSVQSTLLSPHAVMAKLDDGGRRASYGEVTRMKILKVGKKNDPPAVVPVPVPPSPTSGAGRAATILTTTLNLEGMNPAPILASLPYKPKRKSNFSPSNSSPLSPPPLSPPPVQG